MGQIRSDQIRSELHCENTLASCIIGFYRVGLDWIGLDWIGLDWIRLNCIGLHRIALHLHHLILERGRRHKTFLFLIFFSLKYQYLLHLHLFLCSYLTLTSDVFSLLISTPFLSTPFLIWPEQIRMNLTYWQQHLGRRKRIQTRGQEELGMV